MPLEMLKFADVRPDCPAKDFRPEKLVRDGLEGDKINKKQNLPI